MSTVRVAVLGIHHESNTFAARPTTFDDFEIERGHEIVDHHVNGRTTLSGYLDLADGDVDVTPLMFARATPSGAITHDAFERLADELVSHLAGDGRWDGILLALHGAAVSEQYRDVDGELLRRMRATVGDDVPIGVTLDLHANVSEEMVRSSTVAACYRTNPHVDAKERATAVGSAVLATIRGECRPVQALAPVPAVIDILRQNTSDEPMRSLVAAADEIADRPGVMLASIVEGYPYADVHECGLSALVVTDGDLASAQRYARRLGAQVWARRDELTGCAVATVDALDRASRALHGGSGPILLLDVGDNVGGGAAGDSVVILREGMQRRVPLVTIVVDAAGAAACIAAGVDSAVAIALGGRSDPAVGPPIDVAGTVLAVHSGRFEDANATHGGWRRFDAGPTAALALDSGTVVVVTSKAVPAVSPVQLTSLGLDPGAFAAIIAKGVHSPLAGYRPLVSEALYVDTPGCTAADLRRLRYRYRRSPLYPFDVEANPSA